MTDAPVLWRFDTDDEAFGIFIDEDHCWLGNQDGEVFALEHDGTVWRHYQLPEGVRCLICDAQWLYAGCDDGNVYDLSRRAPFVAYEISKTGADILWMDIRDGNLCVSDQRGGLTFINHEGEQLWKVKSGGSQGWMVRFDGESTYHGHTYGVTAYDRHGKRRWHAGTDGSVLFGWQEEQQVYAATAGRLVQIVNKQDGQVVHNLRCDGSVFSCAASPGGRYVFAADHQDCVYCFDHQGNRLWKLQTGCGAAYSMQFHQEKLFLVTDEGCLASVDVSEAAIAAAQAGSLPATQRIGRPAALETARIEDEVETTSEVSDGIVVQCFAEGSRLRVRAISQGYHSDWNVQFPKNIRQENARFVVERLVESRGGDFYRAAGEIRRLVGDQAGPPTKKTSPKKASSPKKRSTQPSSAKKNPAPKSSDSPTTKKTQAAKRPTSKIAPNKKATSKKATSKKSVSQKAVTKKASTQQAAGHKALSKRTVSTKSARSASDNSSRTTARQGETAAQKASAKKTPAKNQGTKKQATKKPSAQSLAHKAGRKKASLGSPDTNGRLTSPTKTSPKNSSSKKASSKKASSKKSAAAKGPTNNKAAKNPPAGTAADKTTSDKKTAAKKTAPTKGGRTGTTVGKKKAPSKTAASKKSTKKVSARKANSKKVQ